jgi:hypothetical protein
MLYALEKYAISTRNQAQGNYPGYQLIHPPVRRTVLPPSTQTHPSASLQPASLPALQRLPPSLPTRAGVPCAAPAPARAPARHGPRGPHPRAEPRPGRGGAAGPRDGEMGAGPEVAGRAPEDDCPGPEGLGVPRRLLQHLPPKDRLRSLPPSRPPGPPLSAPSPPPPPTPPPPCARFPPARRRHRAPSPPPASGGERPALLPCCPQREQQGARESSLHRSAAAHAGRAVGTGLPGFAAARRGAARLPPAAEAGDRAAGSLCLCPLSLSLSRRLDPALTPSWHVRPVCAGRLGRRAAPAEGRRAARGPVGGATAGGHPRACRRRFGPGAESERADG